MNRYFICIILFVFVASHSVIPVAALGSGPEGTRGLSFVEMLLPDITSEGPVSRGKQGIALSVPEFVKGLGMPYESVIADDEYCLLGQVHRWCLQEQNLMVVLLGDSFSSTVDYGAGSRMFALKKCRSEEETSFTGLWGIRLGDADSLVRKKLEYIAGKGSGMVLSKDPEEAPIHAFLYDQKISHQYTIRKGEFFCYFMINKKGILEVIVISRFDVMKTC